MSADSNAVVVIDQAPPQAPATLFDMQPLDMVAYAAKMANSLADVIEKQRLYSNIQGRKYVKVEGWSTLGCMLGILPREKEVTELEDGSYLAVVELYSLKSGEIVGQASALCGIDEKRWGGAERYARRSMAITRATGKAYRLGFSWVMTLAGYEPTPLEEMPEEASMRPAPKPVKATPARVPYDGSPAHEKALAKLLKDRGVEEQYWAAVHDGMKGKFLEDLDSVIDIARTF